MYIPKHSAPEREIWRVVATHNGDTPAAETTVEKMRQRIESGEVDPAQFGTTFDLQHADGRVLRNVPGEHPMKIREGAMVVVQYVRGLAMCPYISGLAPHFPPPNFSGRTAPKNDTS